VVQRGDDREALLLQVEQTRAEALVVVDDVVVAAPAPQQLRHPHGEGARLREAGGVHGADLEEVDGIAELARPRRAERVRVVVEVQAGDLDEAWAGIELRVRLARVDIDLVALGDELAREVPDVDSLAAAVGLAPIRQQGDTH